MPVLKLLHPFSDKCMKKRTKHIVLNAVKSKNDNEQFYYSSLLLYYPHRTEEDLIKNCSSYEKAFMSHRNDFDPVSITLSNQDSEIRRIMLARLFQNSQPLNTSNMNNQNVTANSYNDFNLHPGFACLNVSKAHDNITDTVPENQIHLNKSVLMDEDRQWQRLSTSSILQDEMEIRIRSLTVARK